MTEKEKSSLKKWQEKTFRFKQLSAAFRRNPDLVFTEEDQELLENGVERPDVSDDMVLRMNQGIVNNINSVVLPQDTLWILGDFCFGGGKNNYSKNLAWGRENINCKNVHFILGNHDKPEVSGFFSSCESLVDTKINGQRVTMCHYAMTTWYKSHRGSYMLFGHSHGSLNPWINEHMPEARMLDVGIDARLKRDFMPWHFDEVVDYMSSKKGHSPDHHREGE